MGAFVGLVGNLKALERGKRFIDEDMNRIFLSEMEKDIAEFGPGTSEQDELRELMKVVDHEADKDRWSEMYFVDCHSTSSEMKASHTLVGTILPTARSLRTISRCIKLPDSYHTCRVPSMTA